MQEAGSRAMRAKQTAACRPVFSEMLEFPFTLRYNGFIIL